MSLFPDKNRIALGSFQYLRYSLTYFLETAKRLEMPLIDLWAGAPHFPLDTMSDAQIAEKAKTIRAYGCHVFCVTPEQVDYPWNIAAEDVTLREKSIANTCRAIDAAAMLDCTRVLTTSGRGCYDGDREEAWKRSRDSLYRIAEYALAHGVTVLLETLTPPSSNVINTPEEQERMIDDLPDGAVISVMDLGQIHFMKQDYTWYLTDGRLPGHVHIHDSDPAIHMALGEGKQPVARIIGEIEAAGYKGYYTVETNDARYRMNPRASDEQNMKWLKEQGMS